MADESTPGNVGQAGSVPRREILRCGGAAAAGALILCVSGCGGEKHESQVAKAVDQAAAEISPLSNVPKNGGIVVDSANVVLVRGDGDTVSAFSSICTHAGCSVSEVSDGKIKCPCHGSTFSTEDGRRLSGPATKPLPRVDVKVKDGIVVRA